MATRTVAVRVAVEGLQASIQALKQGGAEGQAALERIGVGARAANQNVERLEKATTSFARVGRSNIIQQAGYQIGDFAVQVQSGTNVVVAATQQLGQLAGAFGVVGAIAGGVISVLGAGIRYWQQQGEETNKAAEELQKLTDGTGSYRDMLQALQPLQVQFLEGLVQGTTAVQAQAQALAQAKIEAAGGLPGGTPTVGEVGIGGAQQGEMLGPETAAQRITRLRAGYTAEENLRIQFIENRKKEEKGLTDFLINQEMERNKRLGASGGTLAKAASGTGGFYDYAAQASSVETYAEALSKLEAEQAKQAAASAAAAKAAETLRISNAKLLEQAKLETGAAQEELDALTMGEDARKRANVEREYEIKLLAAAQPAQKEISLALVDEANKRRELALATIEQSRAIEDAQKKIDASPDAAGGGGLGFHGMTTAQAKAQRQQLNSDFEADAKKAADRQADILAEPWRHLATEVASITTQMFDDILTKGKVSFQSLADGVGEMFKTTITGAIGNIVAAPLTDLANKISTGGMKMPAGGFGFTPAPGGYGGGDYATAAGLGGAGGYAVGATYGQLAGKEDTYAATGGAVGGAIGAGIGLYFGGVGGAALGGMLGGMAGSFIGGMFGGEGLGNDQSVQKFGAKAAKAIWSDKSFSEENRKVTGGIIGQLGQLSEALRAAGADINDVQIAISAGNKTGIQVQGKAFGTDADAAAAAAIKLLLQNTGGLQGSQLTALQTTKGRTADEVMSDLAFAKEFDRLTFAGTAAEAAMRDLGDTFDAVGRRARALGLDENALAAARAQAMNQLMLQAQRQQRDMAMQFQVAISTDPTWQAAAGVGQQFTQLADQLTDAGYSAEQLAQLDAARVRAEQQVFDQAAAQRQAEAQARAQQAQAEAQARAQQAAAAAAQRQQEAEQRRQDAIRAAEERKQRARQQRDLTAQVLGIVSGNDFVQQLYSINTEFAQLKDTMADAGWSTRSLNEVEKARQREIRDAYEQRRRETRDLTAEVRTTISSNDLEKALIAIDQQFNQLKDTLADAGWSLAALNAVEQARQREVAAAWEQERRVNRDLTADVLTMTSQSPLEKTLIGVNAQFDHMVDTLKDAGWSTAALNEVEKARQRAQADAIKEEQRQAQDMQKDLQSKILNIGSFYDDLIRPLQAVNQNNMLNPQGQIGAARAAFQADLSGAGARDPDAIRRLAGSAQQFQQLVQQNYGTGGSGGQYLREIQGGIAGEIAGLQQERAAALADLPQVVKQTTVDIIRENRADIDRVVEQLELLRRDLRGRGIALAA